MLFDSDHQYNRGNDAGGNINDHGVGGRRWSEPKHHVQSNRGSADRGYADDQPQWRQFYRFSVGDIGDDDGGSVDPLHYERHNTDGNVDAVLGSVHPFE